MTRQSNKAKNNCTYYMVCNAGFQLCFLQWATNNVD